MTVNRDLQAKMSQALRADQRASDVLFPEEGDAPYVAAICAEVAQEHFAGGNQKFGVRLGKDELRRFLLYGEVAIEAAEDMSVKQGDVIYVLMPERDGIVVVSETLHQVLKTWYEHRQQPAPPRHIYDRPGL